MWRALFLAVGITLILIGGQLFFVEQLEITKIRRGTPANANSPYYATTPFQQAGYQQPGILPQARQPRTFLYTPKDWMPWSLLAVGAIVMIYTFTIPGRQGRAAD